MNTDLQAAANAPTADTVAAAWRQSEPAKRLERLIVNSGSVDRDRQHEILKELLADLGWLTSYAEALILAQSLEPSREPPGIAVGKGLTRGLRFELAGLEMGLIRLGEVDDGEGTAVAFGSGVAGMGFIGPGRGTISRFDAAPGCDPTQETMVVERGDDLPLSAETRLVFDSDVAGFRIDRLHGDLLMLRLNFVSDTGATKRPVFVDPQNGRILSGMQADPENVRRKAIAGILRAMGRTDAASALAELASSSGSSTDRWDFMRELLALDPRVGIPALLRMAQADPDKRLRELASDVLNSLQNHSHEAANGAAA